MALPPDRPNLRFLDQLGSGGMGAVYRAWDLSMGAEVAAKQVLVPGPDSAAQLKHEFRMSRGAVHPNLVALYELVVDDLGAFFTMELVPGSEIVPYLRRGLPPGVPLDPEGVAELRRVFSGLVDGVRALHRAGVVHRDLKPANVLVTAAGRVVVLDLGVAAPWGQNAGPMPVTPVGTPSYMPPEQAHGLEPVPASDAWALGCILSESLTGVRGWGSMWGAGAMSASAFPIERPDGPDDLVELSMRLRAWEPVERTTLEAAGEVFGGAASARVSGWAPLREPQFFDRDDERQALRDQLDGEGPALVLVQGEAGRGKSAMVRDVLRVLQASAAHVVVSGRCDVAESVPFQAWDGVVDALSERLLAMRPAEVEQVRLTNPGALLSAFPVLGRVPSFGGDIARAPPVDPIEWQQEAFAAFVDLLEKLGKIRRLVIAIDDVAEGDEDSARLLAAVLRSPTLNAAVVLIGRDGAASPLLAAIRDPNPAWCVLQINVGPLATPDAVAVLADLGVDSSRPDFDALVKQAEGSPFLLTELAQQARDGWTVRSVDEAIGHRVATLDSDARAILVAAAVCRVPDAPDFLGAVAEMGAGVREACYRLRRLRLLRSVAGVPRERLEPHHDRVAAVVLAGLSADELSRLHDRAAGLLRARPGGEPNRRLRHLVGANRVAEAAVCAGEAGRLALDALAFEAAVVVFSHAVELEPTVQRLVDLAEALRLAGRLSESGAALERAACRVEPGDPRAWDLHRGAGEAWLRAGDLAQGLAVLTPLLEQVGVRLPATAGEATAEGLWLRIRFMLFGNWGKQGAQVPTPEDTRRMDLLWSVATGMSMLDPARGDVLGLRHLLEAGRQGGPSRRMRALCFEASNQALVGSALFIGRARALVERAAPLAAETGLPADRAWMLMARTTVLGLSGKFRESARLALEAEVVYSEQCTGVDWELVVLRTYVNGALAHLGEVRLLQERVVRGLEDALRRDHVLAATVHRAGTPSLAWLWLDRPEVTLSPDAVPPESEGVVFSALQYFSLIATVRALLYTGDIAGARARIDGDWAPMQAGGYLGFAYTRCEMLVLRAQVLAASGELTGLGAMATRIAKDTPLAHAGPFGALVRALAMPSALAFTAAAEAFEARELSVSAAACRWRSARLDGRVEAAEGIVSAARTSGIVNPERYFIAFAPVV